MRYFSLVPVLVLVLLIALFIVSPASACDPVVAFRGSSVAIVNNGFNALFIPNNNVFLANGGATVAIAGGRRGNVAAVSNGGVAISQNFGLFGRVRSQSIAIGR